ncbi:MAG: GNAT family N-acetyltransferase [Gammaproteobacteria bacterium]|nr:GNAT family N-acetyltransferase [Gammaproteobacteria bacterium]
MELLDFGPMAALGPRFIREICYALHVKDGTLRVALYTVDDEPAGFVAYTNQSISFHRDSLRRHWPYTIWTLLVSLVQDPRRLIALIRALRTVGSRRSEQELAHDPLGEVVCVAVRPEFLTTKFVRRTGLRISEELIRYAAEKLRHMGVDKMRMIVDDDNRPVLFLYHRLGASFEDYEQAGEPKVHVWFDLNDLLAKT